MRFYIRNKSILLWKKKNFWSQGIWTENGSTIILLKNSKKNSKPHFCVWIELVNDMNLYLYFVSVKYTQILSIEISLSSRFVTLWHTKSNTIFSEPHTKIKSQSIRHNRCLKNGLYGKYIYNINNNESFDPTLISRENSINFQTKWCSKTWFQFYSTDLNVR